VCKAENQAGPACRRCKADLALLFRLDDQRQRAVREAVIHLRNGRIESALILLDAADHVQHTEETRQLRVVCHLLHRDYASAWRAYRAVVTPGDSTAEKSTN
jgi:methylphosphotriester-DNA--protein-cysteine methyltransferase